MIIMIDNFDSFTYNLVQYLGELEEEVVVYRNNAVDVPTLAASGAAALVISPGPGRPEGAGVTLPAILALSQKMPILGVCLGHQALAQAFGATIVTAQAILHGKASVITHDGQGIFADLPPRFRVARYHSLVVDPTTLSDEFVICARTDDDAAEVMAIRHRELPLFGVQFHPESILSEHGHALLANFLRYLR